MRKTLKKLAAALLVAALLFAVAAGAALRQSAQPTAATTIYGSSQLSYTYALSPQRTATFSVKVVGAQPGDPCACSLSTIYGDVSTGAYVYADDYVQFNVHNNDPSLTYNYSPGTLACVCGKLAEAVLSAAPPVEATAARPAYGK